MSRRKISKSTTRDRRLARGVAGLTLRVPRGARVTLSDGPHPAEVPQQAPPPPPDDEAEGRKRRAAR